MAQFRISGIWKDDKNVITHYAFHTVYEKTTSRAKKMSKADAIQLLEIKSNTATTWKWNYSDAFWKIGEKVEVVDGSNGKYLRTNPNGTKTDNLEHLIDYDWIRP